MAVKNPLSGQFAGFIFLNLCRLQHAREDLERGLHGIHRIEQRFLVLLQILVVRQRLAFHQGEQTEQVTVDPTGLAPDEFGGVRDFSSAA